MPDNDLSTPANARRRLLRASVFAAAAVFGAMPALCGATQALAVDTAPSRIALLNTHTGEHLDLVYREQGVYIEDALGAIDHLLRDHRNDKVIPIDRALLDTIVELQRSLEYDEPFHVMSAYRSPETNARLAATRRGVARRSLHIEGRAVDIRVPGRDIAEVRRAAVALNAGGVGFYRRSRFIHLDTGEVRTW